MKSIVSVRSIPGVSTNGMAHHGKGCSEDISPDTVILHQGTNKFEEWKYFRENCCRHLALIIQSEKKQSFHLGTDYQK